MNQIILSMLRPYHTRSRDEQENALKEISQEIILCGLSRAGFFHEASFLGGTALRIFHGLNRFSEDLDFSLIKENPQFEISKYLPYVTQELNAYGLEFSWKVKRKTADTSIKSAFIKAETRELLLTVFADPEVMRTVGRSDAIKIKLEIDISPAVGAKYMFLNRKNPIPYEVRLLDMPSLFAGKLHAVICRSWKNRVKGRDFYDYIYYISRQTPVNLHYLGSLLRQTGFIEEESNCLTIEELKHILELRFKTVNFEVMKDDVEPFLNNPDELKTWSRQLFLATIDSLRPAQSSAPIV